MWQLNLELLPLPLHGKLGKASSGEINHISCAALQDSFCLKKNLAFLNSNIIRVTHSNAELSKIYAKCSNIA